MATPQGVNDIFALQRKRAQQQATQAGQQQQEAIKRRFAALGASGSGAAIKQEQLAAQESQKQLGQQMEFIGAAEAQERQRQAEIKQAQEFAKSERLGQQQFASQQAQLAQKYATSERLGQQQFATGERISSQQFAGQQALKQQDFEKSMQGTALAASAEQSRLDRAQAVYLDTKAGERFNKDLAFKQQVQTQVATTDKVKLDMAAKEFEQERVAQSYNQALSQAEAMNEAVRARGGSTRYGPVVIPGSNPVRYGSTRLG